MTLPAWRRWTIWALTLAAVCLLALWRVAPDGPIETDITALLPGQASTPLQDEATQRSRAAFSRELLVLITGPESASVRKAALATRQAMEQHGLSTLKDTQDLSALLALYRKHGFALLDGNARTRLGKHPADAVARDMAVTLASPAGIGMDSTVNSYVRQFLSTLPNPYTGFTPDDGMYVAQRDGRHLYLLRMDTGMQSLSATGSTSLDAAITQGRKALADTCAACSMQVTGAALFANVAQREAKQETLWLSIASTLLIMILIAFIYRSLAPHLLGFVQLVASIVAGGGAVIAVFGSIHILTLVFGTTLIGIAIDYAFLYFSDYWFGGRQPATVPRKIRNGLLIGLATSVLAFAFLALTGFPALTQIALFAVAGLLEAALVVIWIFPVVLTHPPQVAVHAAVRWPARGVYWLRRVHRGRYLIPLALLLLAIPGWMQLQYSDDVRNLSYFPPTLTHTDEQVRDALGNFPASGYFLTTGRTLSQALARERRLLDDLHGQVPKATLIGLSRFLPSPASQQASLTIWQHLLGDPRALQQALTRIGLPGALASRLQAHWQTAPRQPLTATELLATAPALKQFVIHADGKVALLSTALGRHATLDNTVLANLAGQVDGVTYVEPLARIEASLAAVRVRAIWLVIGGYVLVALLLAWRYGLREGLRMVYPSLVAAALALAVLGWLGQPVNVFVVVALILILGLGRDYAVFLREIGADERATALAVSLSALTTIVGFGLLALSRIPVLHAFGLTVGIGILISALMAPFSLPPRPMEEP